MSLDELRYRYTGYQVCRVYRVIANAAEQELIGRLIMTLPSHSDDIVRAWRWAVNDCHMDGNGAYLLVSALAYDASSQGVQLGFMLEAVQRLGSPGLFLRNVNH